MGIGGTGSVAARNLCGNFNQGVHNNILKVDDGVMKLDCIVRES
jgi:hypothetical protein